VLDFFAREFGKSPTVNAPMWRNVKSADAASWMAMVADASAGRAGAGSPPEADREMLVELSMPSVARRFLSRHAPCRFGDYRDALLPQPGADTPTGVCRPFATKVFLTARGEILPCEQIDRCHVLGRVSATAVDMDLGTVAAMYNRCFERLAATCSSCQRAFDCPQCMFMLDLKHPRIQCPHAPSEDEYGRQLAEVIDFLERNQSIVPGV
jgi:uncharacterized protein